MLKVRVRTTGALEQLLSAIQQWKGVSKTLTNVVLSTHKETTNLPLSGMS
jgi:Lrp/AsnC family leucine-responsive transcriptional regulator